jgi:hypothetical protein
VLRIFGWINGLYTRDIRKRTLQEITHQAGQVRREDADATVMVSVLGNSTHPFLQCAAESGPDRELLLTNRELLLTSYGTARKVIDSRGHNWLAS